MQAEREKEGKTQRGKKISRISSIFFHFTKSENGKKLPFHVTDRLFIESNGKNVEAESERERKKIIRKKCKHISLVKCKLKIANACQPSYVFKASPPRPHCPSFIDDAHDDKIREILQLHLGTVAACFSCCLPR